MGSEEAYSIDLMYAPSTSTRFSPRGVAPTETTLPTTSTREFGVTRSRLALRGGRAGKTLKYYDPVNST